MSFRLPPKQPLFYSGGRLSESSFIRTAGVSRLFRFARLRRGPAGLARTIARLNGVFPCMEKDAIFFLGAFSVSASKPAEYFCRFYARVQPRLRRFNDFAAFPYFVFFHRVFPLRHIHHGAVIRTHQLTAIIVRAAICFASLRAVISPPFLYLPNKSMSRQRQSWASADGFDFGSLLIQRRRSS